jgi:hypothetical protein
MTQFGNLQSQAHGQGILFARISAVLLGNRDLLVGTIGFEPTTPTPPARNLGGSDRIAMHPKNLA